MAQNQRDYILSHVQSHMMEWGSGGSTIYFAKKLKGRKLTSIEHDPKWYEQIKVQSPDNHNYLLIEHTQPDFLKLPKPAREEQTYGLHDYICHYEEGVDTILVDGMARGACLAMAYIKYPDATVFLHDANRDWYDWATSLYPIHEKIEADKGDYPPLLLKLTQ